MLFRHAKVLEGLPYQNHTKLVFQVLPYFSDAHIKPLTILGSESAKDFKWTAEHDAVFNHLKTLMTSSPCLTHFDSELPIYIIWIKIYVFWELAV